MNTTLIFNTTQALWAANAGAIYVSPFLGRLADYGYKHDKPERTPGNSLYWVEDHKNAKGDQIMHNSEYVASGGPLKDAGARLIFEIATVFANYRSRPRSSRPASATRSSSPSACWRARTS